MAFKGSNGVAVERRVDLASLFCMIGRHGPAVALVVFAMVSVLAGLVIYRTVRGRRRKKKAAERAEGKNPPAETDEAATQDGREQQACAASTDVGDVANEDDYDSTGTLLKVRHRTTAAAEKSLSPWASDVQVPVDQHATLPHTQRVESVPSSFREIQVYLEEPSRSLQSVGAEIQGESATVCHLYSTDDSFRDEGISEGSLKKPESIRDQICHEEVDNGENQVHKSVTTDEDFSDNKKTRKEEETSQPWSSNQVCFEQTRAIREADHDKQDNKTTAESGTVELDIEEHVMSTDKSLKDEFEEVIQHQDGADPSVCSSDHFAPEEGKKHAVINEEQEREDDRNSTLAAEATEADSDGLKTTAVDFDARSPPLDNPEIQVERKVEHSLTSNQEMDHLPDSELVESCNIVSSREDVSSSVPPMVDNDMPGITSKAAPQIDSVSDVSTNDQQAQKEVPTVDEPPMPSDDTESLCEIIEKATTATQDEAPVDHICEHHNLSFENQSVQELDHNALKTISVGFAPDPSCDIEASIYEDQYGDNTKATTFEQPRFDSPGDTDARDDNFHEDIASSSQDQQNDQNADDFSFLTAPVMTEGTMNPPKLQICLPLFEPSKLRHNICGGGEESGISSMAVSPELLDPGINFDTIGIPAKAQESHAEAKLEPQTCLLVDDATLSGLEEDVVVYEPHTVALPVQPCSQIIDSANDESVAANEGMFGHVIEQGNQRETDKFTVPVRSDDWERQAEMKVAVVSGVNEKLECAENKEAKMEKDEDYAKTEINIMEATMDHNEWITDGNPNFPWLILSLPSFGGENHTSSQQLPTEESNHPDSEHQSLPQVKQIDGWDFEENMKSKKVKVTFRVHYLTHSLFQMLAVTGDQQELGNWKGFIPLESTKDGYWMAVVSLPADNHVQWKFVVVEKGEVCRWEECGNRLLNTGCGKDVLVHKLWGFL
ncbi:uncharacterized protein stbd1 isoform X1 [Phyllopteryx taeniolatus]|uniref:uncharacterized protein stbd1 isoform X1 n=1 Tax=Phyllopteryx taeniolatus TaxID=161469 RepID=UPI002AD36A84|nr:uncharacterized protein stbd1 isoform X1 [Phyllopteryx taeniolatus]